MAEREPILVAGAGPTGLALAAELLRRGAAPRLVDAAERPSVHSKALAVHARTLERLEPLGVTPRLVEAGRPLRALELFAGERRLARVPFDRIPSRYPFVLSLPQAETEALLAARVRELGGRVERGAALAELKPEAEGVRAVLRGPPSDGGEHEPPRLRPERPPAAEAELPPGAEEELSVRWLAGCDGAHSAVRDALGLAFRGAPYPERFALADLTVAPQPGGDAVRGHFTPEGPLAMIPLPEAGTVRAIAGVPADDPDQGAPEDGEAWARRFRERAGVRFEVHRVHWASRFRIHRRRVARLGHGRVLLAGDAAHVHSPVGGQGMNLGLHDALELARLLATAPEEVTPARVLAAYERVRLPAIDAVLEQTALATRLVTAQGALARTLRNAVAATLPRIPAVQDRMATRLAMMGAVHAPRAG